MSLCIASGVQKHSHHVSFQPPVTRKPWWGDADYWDRESVKVDTMEYMYEGVRTW